MSFPDKGHLTDTPLPQIVGHILRTQFTGVVELTDADGINRAFFLNGVPQGARLHRTLHPIGQVLINEKIITQQALDQALARTRESKTLLGNALIEVGVLDEQQVDQALEKQTNLDFLSLFGIDNADYQLREGLVQLSDFRPAPMLPLPTVYRGLRDQAPQRMLDQCLGKLAFHQFRLTDVGTKMVKHLSPAERTAANVLLDPTTTASLATAVALPHKSLAAFLIALNELGFLELDPE